MSKIEVNAIEPQCGTTLTLGANNDTVVLGTGAAFGGGVGAVKWETTPQTGSFQATAGRGYFMNTTSGALTITTPASPSAGDIFAVSDYARTFQTNNLTVAPHSGAKIGGVAGDATLNTEGQTATFVYVDSTEGWINVQETSNSVTGRQFITATGGTVTTCGDFKIHTFTSPGTFCVSAISTVAAENTVGYVVVAGGGGGNGDSSLRSGGGGAGGYREGRNVPIDNFTASPLVADAPTNAVTITTTAFPITVGAGGASATTGSNSIFSTITSAGGGRGGQGQAPFPGPAITGDSGGSGGGGGAGSGCGNFSTGGTGNTPPVSPSQGNNGGGASHTTGNWAGGGGGGGAGAVGGTATAYPSIGPSSSAGVGGNGVASSITGSPVTRGGGGGAGGILCGQSFIAGGSGGGGKGNAGPGSPSQASAGTANTGGGGGGEYSGSGGGKAGGSGIVIIRYKYQ